MALTSFQREVLRLLASNRSPDSVFAGGSVANRDGPRISRDLDIEHVSAEAVRRSFEKDAVSLEAAGYRISHTSVSQPANGFIDARVERDGQETLLDWTHDRGELSFHGASVGGAWPIPVSRPPSI